MRRLLLTGAVLGALCCAACDGGQPTATAPSKSSAPSTVRGSLPPSSATSSAPPQDSAGGLPVPPLKASPDFVPSWMKAVVRAPGDRAAQSRATVAMAGIASALNAKGYKNLIALSVFPARVVRQCTVLNAHLADPDGEAARTFSSPQRTLTAADGTRINAALRPHCT